MIYCDIHTHQPALYSEDITIISIDLFNAIISPEDFLEETNMLNVSEKNGRIYYSVGIHPWHVDKQFMTKVYEFAKLPSVVAIGETGLDKVTANITADFKLQQELFVDHIILSEEVGKPLIVHCVKAWDELLHIRKSLKPSVPWIIHGFRGRKELAHQLLNSGFYLSFGPLHNKEAVKVAWENHHIFAETDDSAMNIRDVYKLLANGLNISEIELSQEIEDLFNSKLF